MRRNSWWMLIGVLGILAVGWCFGAPPKDGTVSTGIDSLDQASVEPGKTITIEDPATGGVGHWLLYIPSDYVASRKWPVIFVFHPQNGSPTIWPFFDLTDGKGFILVGMEYVDPQAIRADPAKNIPNIKRIHEALAKKLPIDDKFQFIGGMSEGGFSTIEFGEPTIDSWAGLIPLAACRNADASPRPIPDYHRKPIYIGIGENDPHIAPAHQSADYYKQHNADLTMTIYPGLAHAIDTKDPTLKKWLVDHGPLEQLKVQFDQAKAAEEAGHKGQAYALYQPVIDQQISSDLANQAKAAAQAIEDHANKAMNLAEKDLTKRLSTGMRDLQEIASVYAGSPMGDKAAARLTEQRTHPTTEPAASQLSAAPVAKPALPPPAPPASSAETQCKQWLNLADNYIQNGDVDQAKVYLQKVIDNYPNTTCADTAGEKLKNLQ